MSEEPTATTMDHRVFIRVKKKTPAAPRNKADAGTTYISNQTDNCFILFPHI